MSAEQVILVVDRSYGGRILDLPTSAALWLVDTVENHLFICALKAKFRPDVVGELTWFQDTPELKPVGLAAQVIDSIEDHHGEYGQEKAFSRLTIVGCVPETDLLAILAELGFSHSSSRDGAVEFSR